MILYFDSCFSSQEMYYTKRGRQRVVDQICEVLDRQWNQILQLEARKMRFKGNSNVSVNCCRPKNRVLPGKFDFSAIRPSGDYFRSDFLFQ